MKKGICACAFPGDMTLEEVFHTAKKCGYDGVELSMNGAGELTPDTSDAELERIRQLAEGADISLYSVTSGLCWAYSLTSDDEEQREKAKANFKRQIYIASKLGCDTVLVVPGHVGVEFAPHLGVIDYQTAYDRALEGIRELEVYARKLGIVIGIENVWNKFLISPVEMRGFVDAVGSEYVKAYFDVGNVAVNGYPEHWIRMLGERIVKVHFKDFKHSVGNINGFCDLLAGDVDYKAVMEALRQTGYDGWVTAEMGPYSVSNEVSLAHASHAMDCILNY